MPRGKAKGKTAGFGDGGGEGGSSWLTTYADAITLLMAFFMMLYAMSQVDQIKFEALIAGFAVPFGNDTVGTRSGQDSLLDSGVGIVGGETARGQQSAQVVDPSDPFFETLQAPTIPNADAAPERTGGDAEATGGLPQLDINQLRGVEARLAEALVEAGFASEVTFELQERGLVVSIATDEVLFPLGSATFHPEGRGVLDVLAPVLSEFGNQVNVEGHTDNSPLNRGGYTNWNLSTDRAVAVVDYFTERFGMTPGRMAAVGYGEFRPKTSNDTRENRARNRRVEVVILAGGS